MTTPTTTTACVFTTTTAVSGPAWGINSESVYGHGSDAQNALIYKLVNEAMSVVAPCALWVPGTSEVIACLEHADALFDFVEEVRQGGRTSPGDLISDEGWEQVWDLTSAED